MSRTLVILRPEPGCSETLKAARALGLRAVGAPLSDVEPVSWELPVMGSIDALLVGSANVFRHGGSWIDELRHLPVLAVGDRTASAAREAGFTVARTGKGGLQGLLDQITGPATLLRLAGEAHVDLTAPAGVLILERVVYRAVPRPLSDEAAELLSGSAVVLLHSAEAARHFAAECDRLAIARDRVAIAALGPRIADAAGPGWKTVRTAAEISDPGLLALAVDMCH